MGKFILSGILYKNHLFIWLCWVLLSFCCDHGVLKASILMVCDFLLQWTMFCLSWPTGTCCSTSPHSLVVARVISRRSGWTLWLWCMDTVVAAFKLSYSVACEIFVPNQESNPHSLHCKVGYSPLDYWGILHSAIPLKCSMIILISCFSPRSFYSYQVQPLFGKHTVFSVSF